MIIRATAEDISTIQFIAKESWKTTYSNILGQEQIDYMLELMYSKATLLEHLNNSNYHYFLINEEGKSLGFIGFEINYEEKTTKLHRIYFLTEARGKGLGKKAIEFITNEIQKIANNRIILTVNKNNQAKNFYEKLGFKVYDEAIFDIGNGYVMDDYLMELVLDK